MSLKRSFFVLCICAVAACAPAQAWKDSYDQALAAAKTGDWAAARTAFLAAIAVRPEDQSTPTTLPGPVTDPVQWRSGAPYSPNFGAGYSSYKLAQALKDDARAAALKDSASSFETLLAKKQGSYAALYFLNQVYGQQGLPDKQRELESKVGAPELAVWKVDTSFVSPEEVGSIAASVPAGVSTGPTKAGGADSGSGTGPKYVVIKPGGGTGQAQMTSVAGRVPIVPEKFALLIGNTQTQMGSGAVSFAASDNLVVQEALVQNAGYDDKNVDIVSDATAGQMLTSAKALADRLPKESTVLIYFSGIGVNVDGKDYLAGIDASMTTDTTKMVAKEELLKVFRDKGSKVFLFCQSNRTIKDGRYFGMEVPIIGRMALCQATSPGGEVFGTVVDGKTVGIYTRAFVEVLSTYRSNKVPITQFAWDVFRSIQGNGDGGSTNQVPSLPILKYIDETTPF